jgi:Carboxypeptidase regulatory-like domain/TonB dependent receptor
MWKLNSFVVLLFAISIPELHGQGTAGSIVGTVKDPTGAIVVGAQVKVRNQATNAVRQVQSNTAGDYSVPLLPPGVYEVQVEQQGFRTSVSGNIGLQVNQTVRVDIELVVGSQNQQVEVTGAAALVNTDTSSLGQVVNQTSVSELPLNQRNFVNFAYLAPGVQLPAEGSIDSTQGLALSANGARETANNFLIDGIDDNDLVINQYSAIPSLDAIQEFKVQSGNYTAEYGRSGGAQVNVLIKNGTNEIHGTAYEFIRNRHMDAKNYFDQPNCTPTSIPGTCSSIPRLDRSQFGASVGGPIVKNKTFFFFAFEYLNLRDATTEEATVPSQVQKQQALAAVPPSLVNQSGLNVLNLYPAANVGANLATSNTFVSAPTSSLTEPYGVAKIDQHFGSNDTLSGHYVASFGDAGNAFDPLAPYTSLPGYGTTVLTHGQNGGVDWTHLFSPKMLNDIRVGFNRELGDFEQTNKTDYNKLLGFPNVLTNPIDLGYPNISVAGYSGIGQPTNTPQVHPTYTLHLVENYAWNPSFDGGRHQLKFGFEYRYYWYSLLFDTDARGIWTFNGGPVNNPLNPTQNPLIQLLYGTPDNATGVNSGVDMDIRAPSYDAYVQDDYRVSSRLTLNLGLRWEFNDPPYEVNNEFSSANLSPSNASCSPKPNCLFIVAGTNGLPRATYFPDYKNFDPRIGLAWRPMNSDRLVIRTAYGMYTDIVLLNANLELRLNPPFRYTNLVLNPLGTANIQNILNQPASVTPPTGNFFDKHFRDAYMQQWNFDVQYSLLQNLLLDVGYVGTRGIHLPGSINVNQPNIGQPSPYPQFGPTLNEIDSDRYSSYNALQAKVERRSPRGGNFLAAYTWSRCIDDGSTLFGSLGGGNTPQYALNLAAEKGLCNFNVNQRLVFSYVYDIPMGAGHDFLGHGFASHILSNWELAGILSVQTGQPFTIQRGVPQSMTTPTGTQDRPNVVGNPLVGGMIAANPGCIAPSQVGIPTAFFNTCAFAAAPGQFGNAGRDNLLGPGYDDLDFSVLKDVVFTEKRRLQFRFEVFNIFNHPNFDLPNNNFDSKTFGQILSENEYGGRPPRQIQLGLKVIF